MQEKANSKEDLSLYSTVRRNHQKKGERSALTSLKCTFGDRSVKGKIRRGEGGVWKIRKGRTGRRGPVVPTR